jgi:hypothetical protein
VSWGCCGSGQGQPLVYGYGSTVMVAGCSGSVSGGQLLLSVVENLLETGLRLVD